MSDTVPPYPGYIEPPHAQYDKCGDCEHTRMEHGDGECESILLASNGGKYRCTCKRFVRNENE